MKKISLIIISIVINNLYLFAQEKSTDKEVQLSTEAESFYTKENYLKALTIYEKLFEMVPTNADYCNKLGICYLYKSDKKQKAIEYLEKAQTLSVSDEDILLNLGRAYHLNGRFNEAMEYLQQYFDQDLPYKEKIALAKRIRQNCQDAMLIVKKPLVVEIQNLDSPVNTNKSESSATISSDGSLLMFTSKDENENEQILVSYKTDNKWSAPKMVSESFDTKKFGSNVSLSRSGKKVFIFSTNTKNGGDIFTSELTGNTWSAPKAIEGEVNSKYWEGSPSLSMDEKTLYFSSDKPGGSGGKDIYKSELKADGKWSKPQSLGNAVNTEDNEDAPFIHADNKTFHFSSQGHNSIGGYDIFVTGIENNKWKEVENIGYPINSTEDDIYYTTTANGDTGYFSLCRQQGLGMEDIYSVSPGILAQKIDISEKIKDTDMDLENVNLKIAKVVEPIKPDAPKEAIAKIDSSVKTNAIVGTENNPKSIESLASTITESKTVPKADIKKNIATTDEVLVTDVLKKKFKIQQQVYFDFNKNDLKEGSKIYAENIHTILLENKEFKLEIAGNADSKGSEKYNYGLSKRRAQAVANYFIHKGIKRERLQMRYNGEMKPTAPNQNPDGSDNVEGMKKNRRVEFKIISKDKNIEVEYLTNTEIN